MYCWNSAEDWVATNNLFCKLRIEAQELIQRVFIRLGMKALLLTVDNDLLPAYPTWMLG